MTKYRRKTENAKERERMKNLNEVFDRLRNIIPDVKTLTHEDKDTKVATLRAAITYIGSLHQLMADLDEGKVDPQDYDIGGKRLSEKQKDSNDIVRYKNKSLKKKITADIDFCTVDVRKRKRVIPVTLSRKIFPECNRWRNKQTPHSSEYSDAWTQVHGGDDSQHTGMKQALGQGEGSLEDIDKQHLLGQHQ